MKVIETMNETGVYTKYNNIIITWKFDNNGYYLLMIHDKYNFKIIKSFKFGKERMSKLYLDDKLVIFDKHDNSTIIDLSNYEKSTFSGPLIYSYFWEDATLCYDSRVKKYKIISNGEVCWEFIWNRKFGLKFIPSGILEVYSKGKENNYLQCKDYKTGEIKWKKLFDWSVNSVYFLEDLIIISYWIYNKNIDNNETVRINYVNPLNTTLVLNSKNGDVIWWGKNLGLNAIDYKNKTVVSGGNIIRELDVNDGNIINKVKVSPVTEGGYDINHCNDTSYYYKLYTEHIGEINKVNGNVEWEYSIKDENNCILQILDWTTLGNGNILVKVDNQINDPIYLFDPLDNQEFSRIQRGERITSI